jgi:hypothetical protein
MMFFMFFKFIYGQPRNNSLLKGAMSSISLEMALPNRALLCVSFWFRRQGDLPFTGKLSCFALDRPL